MDAVSYVLAKNAGKAAAERVTSSLAAAYDPSQAYAEGALVVYDSVLWEATIAVPAGVWDATKWMQTTVADHLGGSTPTSRFFLVTVSYDDEEGWAANHSATECFAAREVGKQVLFKIEQDEDVTIYVEGQAFVEDSNTITTSFIMDDVVYSCSLTGTSVVITQKNLSNIDSLTPAYNSSNQYLVGDVVNYNGNIYQAITTITTPESFDENHWELTNIWNAAAKMAITTEAINDPTLTLEDIVRIVERVNDQGKHVFFDASSLEEQMYLCTIYFDDYDTPTKYRVVDAVTGKTAMGTYNADKLFVDVLEEAVEDFVTITVSCTTLDGVLVTGQTVTLRNGSSAAAPIVGQKAYNGQPVSFVVAKDFIYYVSVTDNVPQHFNPTTATGVATTDTLVSLTYSDLSNIRTYSDVAAAVASLDDPTVLIGNVEIADTWTDGSTTYDDPAIVVSVETVEDEDGNTHTAAIMQRKYAAKTALQFDAPEQEEATEETAQEGVFYFGLTGANFSTNNLTLLTLNPGDPIPYSDYDAVYHTSISGTNKDYMSYGYNRYRDSGVRQWLNSEETEGAWWQSTHIGDCPPSGYTTTNGYLYGCSEAMKAAAKPIKVSTYTNSVTDGSVIDITIDKIWLPSGTQMYGVVNDNEGTYFKYWKEATDLDSFSNDADIGRKIYSITNHSSVQTCLLRSTLRSDSYLTWSVYDSGDLDYDIASYAFPCAPAWAVY